MKIKKRENLKILPQKNFVRGVGLEPTRLSPPDPKSGAATNYAISAILCHKGIYFFRLKRTTNNFFPYLCADVVPDWGTNRECRVNRQQFPLLYASALICAKCHHTPTPNAHLCGVGIGFSHTKRTILCGECRRGFLLSDNLFSPLMGCTPLGRRSRE